MSLLVPLAALVLQADTLPPHVRAAHLVEAAQLDSARTILDSALTADSTYAGAWRELGLLFVRAADRARRDTAARWSRTPPPRHLLDSAEVAFRRAQELGDALAGAYRVFSWGERALLGWEEEGVAAAGRAFAAMPDEARLPAVLEELGENLLRACPDEGVILTAREEDTYSTLYLRFGRGLRTDLYIIPLPVWNADERFRRRVTDELGLGKSDRADRWLNRLAERRPVCASAWLETPPTATPPLQWLTYPFIWATGPGDLAPVPAREFVFVALLDALRHAEDPWSPMATEFYRRAVARAPALCNAMRAFGIEPSSLGCPR